MKPETCYSRRNNASLTMNCSGSISTASRFNKHDTEEMHRLVRSAPVRPGLTDTLLGLQAGTEAYYGHLKKARDLTTRAREFAHQNDDNETAAGYVLSAATWEIETGDRNKAVLGVTEALATADARSVQPGAALVLARAGQAPRAQAIAADLKKRFPLDTLINSLWVPTIEAAVELDRGNGARALAIVGNHVSLRTFFRDVFLFGLFAGRGVP